MTRTYKATPGSLAHRAIELLREVPPGTEIGTRELAQRIGADPGNLTKSLESAVAAGVLDRRSLRPDVARAPSLWRLGGTTPLVELPPPPPPPAKLMTRPADGEPVITAQTKFTQGPSHPFDERYQVDPKSRPFGAGFAACGVGRDVETGRAWR